VRVTFVLPHAGMSGGNRVLAIYADRLSRRNHDVTVVSTPPKPPMRLRRKIKSLLRGEGWPRDPESQPSFFEGIPVRHDVLESVRPVTDADVPDGDVVLATYWRTGPWVAALSSKKGAKGIFLQGYETSPGREDPAMDAVWRLPMPKIVISKWLVELARERFGATRVYHVPNSVSTEQFFAPPRVKQQVPAVGLLYATLHLKGLDVSLKALEAARQRLGRLDAIAFGAERVSKRLALPPWVAFHYRPPQHTLRSLYAKCDVWLCGSRREGFHLPPLEAMACRCPVVSTRVGGPEDVISDGINGFLVNVEDSDGLAAALVRVLTLPDRDWIKMSDAALETARNYTWDNATDLLECALEDIRKNR
jgi:glycosyltransferase involved in cell wall biosynthesis